MVGDPTTQISLVDANEISKPDLETYRKPVTHLEKENAITDTNKKMARKTNLRHRRTTQRCNGIRKIVQCKVGVAEEICKKALLDAGVELLSDMPLTAFFAICVVSEYEARLVAALTEMEGVEDDHVRTLSYIPGSKVVRKLQSNEQVIPYGVDLVKAPAFWDKYGKRGGGVKICVIDSGVRSSHEDLRGGDVSGSNDSVFLTPWNEDGYNHGTHVSGTILATDNGVGVIGVAPEASIYMVRVFDDSGENRVSGLVDAMNACASAGAKIISMSLSGPSQSSAESTTVANLKDSGILLVAASGNHGDESNFLEFPAAYEPVMSLAAVDRNLDIAMFSSYNTQVDIAGPGVDVLSTITDSDTGYVSSTSTTLSNSPREIWAHVDKTNFLAMASLTSWQQLAYLENGGGTAPEQSSCVDVSVSLTTDDYGSETYYFITLSDDVNKTMYRGGPYPDSTRSTYTDDIKLQEGCYNLILIDIRGDGTNDPNSGIGAISLTYKGNKEVDFNNFGGFREVSVSATANGGSNPTTPSPTSPPVASPTSPPATTPSDPVPDPQMHL